ncbi:hypothetical protein CRG98_045427 [Punica granatum]|uniref:Uncharacterized protein n=1 Tax=Punica granatum TaxID=22663 RepID=A0A2I0HR58_PUNGR|nr:hypothetical protein CRG98_045427 [Punica granatum]
MGLSKEERSLSGMQPLLSCFYSGLIVLLSIDDHTILSTLAIVGGPQCRRLECCPGYSLPFDTVSTERWKGNCCHRGTEELGASARDSDSTAKVIGAHKGHRQSQRWGRGRSPIPLAPRIGQDRNLEISANTRARGAKRRPGLRLDANDLSEVGGTEELGASTRDCDSTSKVIGAHKGHRQPQRWGRGRSPIPLAPRIGQDRNLENSANTRARGAKRRPRLRLDANDLSEVGSKLPTDTPSSSLTSDLLESTFVFLSFVL